MRLGALAGPFRRGAYCTWTDFGGILDPSRGAGRGGLVQQTRKWVPAKRAGRRACRRQTRRKRRGGPGCDWLGGPTTRPRMQCAEPPTRTARGIESTGPKDEGRARSRAAEQRFHRPRGRLLPSPSHWSTGALPVVETVGALFSRVQARVPRAHGGRGHTFGALRSWLCCQPGNNPVVRPRSAIGTRRPTAPGRRSPRPSPDTERPGVIDDVTSDK